MIRSIKRIRVCAVTFLAFLGSAGWVNGLQANEILTTTITVNAKENSWSGGKGSVAQLDLRKGDHLTIRTSPDQRWSAGSDDPCSRTSNTEGLAECYGPFVSGNLTANYGSLVGRIGSEDPFYVGTDFDQEINTSGPLSLYYWDSNAEDNSGTISVTIRLERIETASDASAGPQIKFFLLSNQENSLSGEMPYGEVFVVHVEYDEPQDDDVKRLDLTWNDEMLSLDVTAGSDKHIYTSESLFLLSPDEEN